MQPITYQQGDATAPPDSEPRIIAHVCNDIGGWGRGFVLALSKRWPQPEQAYRNWYANRTNNDFALGAMQLIPVEHHLHVANMIAQHDIRPRNNVPPIRYEALASCLEHLAREATTHNASVHMPRIGCGLAGGTWDHVGPLVEHHLSAHDIAVTVYDFA